MKSESFKSKSERETVLYWFEFAFLYFLPTIFFEFSTIRENLYTRNISTSENKYTRKLVRLGISCIQIIFSQEALCSTQC